MHRKDSQREERTMSDCIFCKLANGDIPTTKLYEDDNFAVILDANPATKGHCLILPKGHYSNIYDMPEELTGEAFKLAQKIAKRLSKAMNCDGLNIVQNNGPVAGQSVFHFHIHLVPRYKDGQIIVANWTPTPLSDEWKNEIVEKFNAPE